MCVNFLLGKLKIFMQGILSKEAGSSSGFYTHQSFLGVLYTNNFLFFCWKNKKKENIDIFWFGFCIKMTSQSNIVGVLEYG